MLKLESLDTVALNFTYGLVANGSIKGTIQTVVYNSQDKVLEFEVWTSVRSGEMSSYVFAWPATSSAAIGYPTILDLYSGGA